MPEEQLSRPGASDHDHGSRGPSVTRAELIWPGKYDASGVRRSTPNRGAGGMELRCEVLQTTGSAPRGRLIHGDFRQALPVIEAGTIDFIYADPPFRTGRPMTAPSASNGARHQPSSKHLSSAAYGDDRSEVEQLELLDDLIMHAHRILKTTGSMALHLDHRCSAHAQCLLNEHFGSSNFVNELIWHYGLGNARASRHFLRKHDNILIYAKSQDYFFRRLRGPVTKAQQHKYCHEDEHGRYMLSYGKKYYLKGGKPLDSVLDVPGLGATDGERCGYPTQKPIRLLSVLIDALCPESGIVLDPCAGSGTTAVAADRLGRTWVVIDESATAIEHATARMQAETDSSFTIERCDRHDDQPIEERPVMACVSERE